MAAGVRRRPAAAGSGSAGAGELSVIVPTFNETENIRPLTERLFKATQSAGITTELIFVDDESPGSDATQRIVGDLLREGHAVRIHCRKRAEGRGLSSAVLIGFDSAKYGHILCMDADLQHEPESVPDVARPVLAGEAEFSVGSRNVDGGGLGFDWSLFRQVVSQGATLLAWPVAQCTDPMSGFFCTRTDVLARGRQRLNPIGFKIGLEVMVRCKCTPVKDVGITFQERAAGESKLSAKHYKLYLVQLASLYWEKFQVLIVLLMSACLLLLLLLASWTARALR